MPAPELGILVFMLLARIPVGISLIAVSFGGIWMLIGPRPAWASCRRRPTTSRRNGT
jgi:hypothetical protein